MVDEALYKHMLLAVATREQNERTLTVANEQLEQHMLQIKNSHERVNQREKERNSLDERTEQSSSSFSEICQDKMGSTKDIKQIRSAAIIDLT